MNFHVNSKNKKRKIVFSFVSAHCAPFKKVESKLRGRGLLVVSWDRDKIQNRLNQKKNQIPDFYFLSYGWLYLQFTGDTLEFLSMSPTKSSQIYRKDAQWGLCPN